MPTDNKPDKDLSGQDKISTFEDTRKYVINQVWSKIPKWLRITIVSVIIISTPVIATQSFWYPTVTSWIFPPVKRIIFRGYIYSNINMQGMKTRVQLIDKNENQITEKESDDEGLVVFNIPDNKEIKNLKCLFSNNWQTYNVDSKSIKSGKKFVIIPNKNLIEWK